MSNVFNCIACGTCCRSLPVHPLFATMHNGDGVCFNLDRETNLCSIYETRPLICNIERGWREIFWSDMTIEEWIEMNEEACKKLRGV